MAAKRKAYTDEDSIAAFERCEGDWKWREDRKRLEFQPKISPAQPLRNDDDGQQDMLVWPACRARVTWPRLSTVWDTFGTEPETPSRQEKPAVIKACEGWMQACMAPVSMDMPQRTGRLNLQGRKSYFNLPLQRQTSVINTSRHMSRRDLFAPSDCGSVAASIKSQPSGKLVAAKLTYTREGPVTLEIVKGT
eukprot:scpid92399/ scgid0880/ 